jgi:hypothetical protein
LAIFEPTKRLVFYRRIEVKLARLAELKRLFVFWCVVVFYHEVSRQCPIKKMTGDFIQFIDLYGASGENRTRDPHITNVLLYRLSYTSVLDKL